MYRVALCYLAAYALQWAIMNDQDAIAEAAGDLFEMLVDRKIPVKRIKRTRAYRVVMKTYLGANGKKRKPRLEDGALDQNRNGRLS